MNSENRNNSGIVPSVCACLLGVAIPFGAILGGGFLSERNTERQNGADLLWEANDRADEEALLQADAEKQMSALYRSVLDVMEQSIPGIVCWGDSVTATVSGAGSAYPAVLQQLIQNELSTAFARLYPADFAFSKTYRLSVPLANMSVPGESSLTVVGRSGAIPFVIEQAVTIPSDAQTAVRLYITSETGETVEPLVRGSAGLEYVSIGGVIGKLELTRIYGENSRYAYYFTRKEAGDEVTVGEGTAIVTAAQIACKDYVSVIQLGNNGGWRDADDLITQIRALIDAQADPNRYVVLGLTFGDMDELQEVNRALADAFGDHFIDLWQYMREDALEDAGLGFTSADIRAIEDGELPITLTDGTVLFNQTAHQLIAEQLLQKMHELGYFDAIDAKLNITE